MTPIVAYKVPTDSRHMRVVVDVPVTELVRLLNGQRQVPNGLTVDHVYDY